MLCVFLFEADEEPGSRSSAIAVEAFSKLDIPRGGGIKANSNDRKKHGFPSSLFIGCISLRGKISFYRVRRGYVVSALGSNPARQPLPLPFTPQSPAQENPGAWEATVQIFPSAAAGDTSPAAVVLARHQGRILYQYCRQ
jgi:hypothetical protein